MPETTLDRPSVSVVVPVYDGARTLRRAVESIADDPLKDVEVLIVDDGSVDDSLAVAQSLRHDIGPRIRVIAQGRLGGNVARNRGLDEARGRYIQFLDCDDRILDAKLSRSVELFAQNRELRCVYSDGVVDSEQGHTRLEAHYGNLRGIAERSGGAFTCGLQTNLPVWDREFLVERDLRWHPTLGCWQETEFYFRVLSSIGGSRRVHHLARECVEFSRRTGREGVTSRYWSRQYLLGQRRALGAIADFGRSQGLWNRSAQDQLAQFRYLLLVRSLVGGEREIWNLLASDVMAESAVRSRRLFASIPWSVVRPAYRAYAWMKAHSRSIRRQMATPRA